MRRRCEDASRIVEARVCRNFSTEKIISKSSQQPSNTLVRQSLTSNRGSRLQIFRIVPSERWTDEERAIFRSSLEGARNHLLTSLLPPPSNHLTPPSRMQKGDGRKIALKHHATCAKFRWPATPPSSCFCKIFASRKYQDRHHSVGGQNKDERSNQTELREGLKLFNLNSEGLSRPISRQAPHSAPVFSGDLCPDNLFANREWNPSDVPGLSFRNLTSDNHEGGHRHHDLTHSSHSPRPIQWPTRRAAATANDPHKSSHVCV